MLITARSSFRSVVPRALRQTRPASLLTTTIQNALPEGLKPSGLPKLESPLSLLQTELSSLQSNISHLLGSGHPSLDSVAKYYFQAEGKNVRPKIVLLMAQATNGLGSNWQEVASKDPNEVDRWLTQRDDVLNDYNPGMPESTRSFQNVFIPSSSSSPRAGLHSSLNSPLRRSPSSPAHSVHLPSGPLASLALADPTILLPTQKRLAEITEMIHVASLLHDDVIDVSPTRRGAPSAPNLFGNKVSILGGDFLLGRASAALARLGSPEVVELLSTVIANLVEGEMMQLKATQEPERSPTAEGFDKYMQKTYLKTASLMAKSARASVILGGAECDEELKDVAYAYGRNLGIAFQLVDDLLDFTPTPSTTMGKPSSGFDLSLGLATAPLLYAWESNPSLTPLIRRGFSEPGDVPTARDLVLASDGMDRTRKLAREYAEGARDLIRDRLPESEARAGLEDLTEQVLKRCK
ncbi:Geranylgeranyl pyrophosphate synthase/Polyprenyl synthetase [Phaffia rhodozyma]|uniref:(2E,6E)-farnesyl diphosphate synthase n=1 Tax=Phaffia rhodozyma TaxID=264483 RepID=A0A0F7SPU6_PHARH|nr:Geranylgeranyl pyrophosphate synthase/Polyprenyl synthetase [Phaffia rhodozyma]